MGCEVRITAHESALHRIRGINSLDEINGNYAFASSRFAMGGVGRINWFTYKLGADKNIGNGTEGDASIGGADASTLTIEILKYKPYANVKSQYIHLKHHQISRLKRIN